MRNASRSMRVEAADGLGLAADAEARPGRGFQAKMSKCAQGPGRGANRCRNRAAVTEPGLGPAVGIVLDARPMSLSSASRVAVPQRHAATADRTRLRAPRRSPRPGRRRRCRTGGSCGPSATRAAPVRVARSMVSAGSSSPARVRASARISRPSASVLPTSTDRPLRGGQHVARPHGVARDGVLDHRDQHRQAHRQAGGHHHPAQRQGVGGAAHVLLHQSHAGRRLDVQAAGVEHHALADDATRRLAGLAPASSRSSAARGPARRRGRRRGRRDSWPPAGPRPRSP